MRMQDILGAGLGGADVPYDQTQPADADVLAGAQMAGGGAAPPPMGGGMPMDPLAQQNAMPTMEPGMGEMPPEDPMAMAGEMGAGPEELAPDTDMLSDEELAAVDSPEAPSMDDVMGQQQSPEEQAALEQMILMAARRQAAGL